MSISFVFVSRNLRLSSVFPTFAAVTALPMKFSPGGANKLWPLVVPVIYLSIVTLPFGGSCSRKCGTNLANFGQNQMPVGTTMKRYSDHIGLYNTQVAGKMLQ
jgi:uncharacterized membrane protein YccF (DUF307 family)